MLDLAYFKIFNSKIDIYSKINLMGIIAFWKSAIKHIRRGSRLWMILSQLRGVGMCAKQLTQGAPRGPLTNNAKPADGKEPKLILKPHFRTANQAAQNARELIFWR